MPLHKVPLDAAALDRVVGEIEQAGEEITYLGETSSEYVIVTRPNPKPGPQWTLRSVA